MPRSEVGLYCDVVSRFGLLVSKRTVAACESRAIYIQRAGSLPAWLGALNLGSAKTWL